MLTCIQYNKSCYHYCPAGKAAQSRSQLSSASFPSIASQSSREAKGSSQPASSGWDDNDEQAALQTPAHQTANSGRGRGRAGSARGRAAVGSLPHSTHTTLPDTWGLESNASLEGEDGWGDPVLASTPGSRT